MGPPEHGRHGRRRLPHAALLERRALACGDIAVDDRVEVDGRERYRTGKVIAVGPYEFETDTMFPCMAFADIPVDTGDSGAAVLVDGQPAGVIARRLGNGMGFTPLAEGLDNLGLTLCTTPGLRPLSGGG